MLREKVESEGWIFDRVVDILRATRVALFNHTFPRIVVMDFFYMIISFASRRDHNFIRALDCEPFFVVSEYST